MKSIFDNDPNDRDTMMSEYKFCEYCGIAMAATSEETLCEPCRQRILFHKVKEFIRQNDVTEFEVATHFDLPLRVVKGWIKEGRIEYKENNNGKRELNYRSKCERCGVPISFGSLCPKCLKTLNNNVHGYGMQTSQNEDRMFFLDNDSNPKKKK